VKKRYQSKKRKENFEDKHFTHREEGDYESRAAKNKNTNNRHVGRKEENSTKTPFLRGEVNHPSGLAIGDKS